VRLILVDLFEDEGIAVSPCSSLEELMAESERAPDAVLLFDPPWSPSNDAVAERNRASLADLSLRRPVILTLDRDFREPGQRNPFGQALVFEKPYSLERLLQAVLGAAGRD
jgi:hypothetical protein